MLIHFVTHSRGHHRKIINAAADDIVECIPGRNAFVTMRNITNTYAKLNIPIQFFALNELNRQYRVNPYTLAQYLIVAVVCVGNAESYLRVVGALLPFFFTIGAPEDIDINAPADGGNGRESIIVLNDLSCKETCLYAVAVKRTFFLR